MRLAFLVLLLANLLLYFWGQGYLGTEGTGREPERMSRQIGPEKLRILPEDAPPRPALATCKRIEGLADAEATAIRNSLETLPGWELRLTRRQEEPSHRVMIIRLANRTLANNKKVELRELGVRDGEVIESDNFGPYAVLLGEVRSRPLAEELLQSLAKKGVRTAQIVRHEMAATQFSLELRAPAAVLDSKLPGLMLALPQASLQDCTTTP